MLYLLVFVLLAFGRCDKTTFDCPMRQLALNFAAYIQPNLSMDQLQEVADALNGAEEAQNCNVSPNDIPEETLNRNKRPQHRPIMDWSKETSHLFKPSDAPPVYIYVDPKRGEDSNAGTLLKPFRSIETAVLKSRSYGPKVLKYIILRKGRHYLKKTIEFTSKDSNLIMRNYNNELVEISGALPLNCNWQLYKNMTNNMGIYTCKDSSVSTMIQGLRVDGNRAIRARYPNANPETQGFGSSLQAKSWLPPTGPALPTYEYNPEYPERDQTADGEFWYYNLGMGGPCDNFSPSAGYWCSANTQGGGAFTYKITTGLTYDQSILPNTPYADPEGLVVQTWRPGHWSSWMFEVGSVDNTTDTMIFSKGGFQGARGDSTGDEIYVENVFEELDYPMEWFYNQSTNTLYYYNNATGVPNAQFEYTNLKVLFNYSGSMSKPVVNISQQGITFRDTRYTYLDPHGMPSGGDWGLQRTGGLYLNGVENVIISNNLFTRLDGNTISVNRYARNVTIDSNEIIWNGDSAVTMWGDTQGILFPNEGDPTEMGWDGTDGNQPRGVRFTSNFVHEIGIWEKQSSMWFQAKSCQNYLGNNVFFNGPRAGINFNDGFGGGSELYKNLLFNTCRESGDHGPFNSWDRQVYVTTVNDGQTPSVIKAMDVIQQNFMIANYNSQEAIDNDDGSCYYYSTRNFLVYSGNGLKSDFGGHDNHHVYNIYGYISKGFQIVSQSEGHNDEFRNNTLVLTSDASAYGSFSCSDPQDQWPILGYNMVSTPSGDATKTGLCGKDEATFQSQYNYDLGTTISGLPDDTALLNQAQQLLWQ